jgi:hypothetical protein
VLVQEQHTTPRHLEPVVYRRHLAAVLAVLAAGTVALTPADAAAKKPKPFKGSKSYTDQTPDPTGSTTSGSDCSSAIPATVPYPKEAGITVTIPAPGKLKVTLANKLDWALEIRDPKKVVIGSSDGSGPQDVEGTTVKAKKAGKYTIIPCNLGAEPTITVSWQYTPA